VRGELAHPGGDLGLDALLGAIGSGVREARRVWDTGLDALAEQAQALGMGYE